MMEIKNSKNLNDVLIYRIYFVSYLMKILRSSQTTEFNFMFYFENLNLYFLH